MGHASTADGLRERKKSATRDAIARAALDLFDRQGFADTTIAAIAEAADVSARTVSSYFPVKEELALPDSAATFERLAARLRERPPGETTAEAMRAWFRDELPQWEADDELARRRRRIIAADERLQHHERRLMARAEGLLAASIAQDLGQAEDALEPRMAAAATIAIFHVLRADRDAALGRGEHTRRPCDDNMQLLNRALTFVGGGVRALQS
jgi:AcrR family transcriptional regulator